MKNSTLYLIAAIGVVIGLLLVFSDGNKPAQKLGSIDTDANAYLSTTTDVLWDNSHADGTNYKIVKKGRGTLGSVVVTTSVAGALNLYDATTTDKNLRTNTATTTLAKIPVSVAAGTYTFDAVFNYGLVVEFPTALGAASTTITYR